MSRTHAAARGALFLAAAGLGISCSNNDASVVTLPVVNPLFQSYVSIGNSITAGFQSDGINDSTQAQAYPVLLAKQMHTRFAFPALAMPGCRPPIDNFLTQSRVTLPGQTPPSNALTCALRDAASVTTTINNVAVPGIQSADPTQVVEPHGSILTQLFLGGKSMIAKALDASPTFATVWVGNNDVLGPAIQGQPAGATSQANFVANYSAMISQLLAGAPNVKGVLIGVVQVANAPVLFTAQALQIPAFRAGLNQATGKTIVIDPVTCTPTTKTLIGFPLISLIASGQHPPFIACEKTPTPPVGDLLILDAAEQVQVANIVNGYNTYIKAKADSIGFAYYDPNTTLARLATQDPVLATHVPNIGSATAAFGQFVTLDGIHPSAAAHIQIANDLISIINAKYGTNLTPLQ